MTAGEGEGPLGVNDTLILVPTYNERDNVVVLVPRLFESIPQAHVMLIDDASPDGTADAAELASIMVTGWMKRRGHRRNILDPALRCLGVGVAISDRVVMATQLYGG